MLFRNLVALCLFSCMSLSCSPDTSAKNVEQFCPCHSDNEETVLKLVHINAQDAKSLCDEIIASCDEFSSVNVEIRTEFQTRRNSLVLTGRAREVHLLEWNLRYKALPACRHKIYCPSLAVGYYYSPAPVAFRDNEYTVSELKLFHVDAQDTKKLWTSCNSFSSVNVEVQTHTNSLVLTGLAYTVYRIEEFIIKYVDLQFDTPKQDCP